MLFGLRWGPHHIVVRERPHISTANGFGGSNHGNHNSANATKQKGKLIGAIPLVSVYVCAYQYSLRKRTALVGAIRGCSSLGDASLLGRPGVAWTSGVIFACKCFDTERKQMPYA